MQQEIPYSSIDVLRIPMFFCGFGLMIYILCLISFKVNRRLTWGRWSSVPFFLAAIYVASTYFFKLVGFGPGAADSSVYNALPFSRLMIASHWLAFFLPLIFLIIQFLLDIKLRKVARRIKSEEL